jgi:hypothetical protein
VLLYAQEEIDMNLEKRLYVSAVLVSLGGLAIWKAHLASLLNVSPAIVWASLGIVAVIVFALIPGPASAVTEEKKVFKTDPEFLAAINAARCVHELVDVLDDNDSSEFSDEENLAFHEKATSLHLTQDDWLLISDAVQGEESHIQALAEEQLA